VPLSRGCGAGSPSDNVASPEAYLHNKWHLDPSRRLETTDVGRELGAHPSTKSLSDFSEIWYVHRGRCVMHDGMPYDSIEGQGHGVSEVLKIALFKVNLIRH